MPFLLDTRSRSKALIDAINFLIARDGPGRLSLRRIARECGVSPGSMMDHFGNKARLLQLAATVTARARQEELARRLPGEGALAFLPRNNDEIVDYRVWLAWQELARSDSAVEGGLERARAIELSLLQHATRLDDHDDVEILHALLDGLTAAICHPAHPMSLERARGLVTRHRGDPNGHPVNGELRAL